MFDELLSRPDQDAANGFEGLIATAPAAESEGSAAERSGGIRDDTGHCGSPAGPATHTPSRACPLPPGYER